MFSQVARFGCYDTPNTVKLRHCIQASKAIGDLQTHRWSEAGEEPSRLSLCRLGRLLLWCPEADSGEVPFAAAMPFSPAAGAPGAFPLPGMSTAPVKQPGM